MAVGTLRHALHAVGVFDRLRFSPAYELFLRAFRPAQVRAREEELRFYRELLTGMPGDAVIFDVGGNRGYKSLVFRRLSPRVICVEPDRSNVDILRKTFASSPGVTVVDCAVGSAEGEMTLNVMSAGSAYNTLSSKWVESLGTNGAGFQVTDRYPVRVVTLDALIARYGRPYYIKIDVEGFELEVIRGLSQPVPVISFELNLPDFRSEGLEIIERLTRIMPEARVNYCGTPAAEAYSDQQSLNASAWLTPDEFSDLLRETTRPYMEVYVRQRG